MTNNNKKNIRSSETVQRWYTIQDKREREREREETRRLFITREMWLSLRKNISSTTYKIINQQIIISFVPLPTAQVQVSIPYHYHPTLP